LLCLHDRPINVLVLNVPRGRFRLEEGFALICFQRLSVPDIATLRCHERDNRYTRGPSTPILSY